MLRVESLTKEFATRAEPLRILNDVTFSISPGESMGVLGPSGSGKSTLLHVLGTLDRPTSGSITLAGQNPFTLPEPALARFRGENVGFVFQDHHLLPQLSALENTLAPTLAGQGATAEHVARAKQLLARVGLAERLEHRPAELSGGERQRVAVARALLNKPKLVLADEPTGNLDRTNAQAIGRLLLELQASERNILIVVTHSAELGALMQRRVELENGQLKDLP